MQQKGSEVGGSLPAFGQPSHQRITPTHPFAEFALGDVEQSIASRFEQQVDQYADVLALRDQAHALTYGELNCFANRIAHTIGAQRGTQSESVALLFEQGASFLAAIFGVLKTGKYYVPIDPSFPEARNTYILEDSQARLIVTNRVNLAIAQSLAAGRCDILNIDDIPADTPSHNLGLQISPDTLAYIIYTSGSTGKPKGVFQNQRNVLHNCRNQTNAFHLGVGDRMPLVHSCSVMGAVRVIYNALLNGVSLYPLDIKAEGFTALRNLLLTERITVFHAVATLFRHCSDIFTGTDQFPHLRLVILGGEAMSRKDVELYQQYFPDDCLLCTGLGSTEAGTIRVFMLNKQMNITSSLVPPGYAVDGVDVLLLDETGQDVLPGEVGEIVVKSRYLALGYWQRPDLTAAAFETVPDRHGERLLRTGDLGYFLPDGCLVHVGRKDFQVKIRGYRVNVSEVEMALMDYGFLKEVIVVGREDIPGEVYLVAYVVPRQQPGPTISELRQFLAQKLPDYMMPSRFVVLEALPLTANGKVNRLGLPAPAQIAAEVRREVVPPRTETEQRVAQVWAEVLQLEQVSIHDPFLEVGGNSLLGMRLMSRLRDQFNVPLLPQQLFDTPSVAHLAATIDQCLDQCADKALSCSRDAVASSPFKEPRILRRTQTGPVPLSFAQQRLWVFEQLETDSATYVVTKALRLTGELQVPVLQRTFDTLVERHEILRTSFLVIAGEPMQAVNPPRPVELPILDLSQLDPAQQEQELQQILQTEDQTLFDLSRDLLLRVKLIRLAPKEHVLVLVRHHLASDGWSLGLIWQKISILYTAFLADQPSPLPELPIQFADFASWERQWLKGEVLERQLEYWQQQLAGAPPLLQLPTDRPRPPIQTFNGRTESVQLSQELSAQLAALSRQAGATLFMTLLTTFVVLLARYSGQQDILVGTMVANRDYHEVEPLIGFFSNLLVLRTQIEGRPTFWQLLQQIRNTVLTGFSHKDIPFEQLTTALKPNRSPSHTPWFQVLFMLQNFPMEYPNLPGLSVEPIVVEESAKYDLTLTMTETVHGLKADFAYNTDLFDPSTIQRLVGHFQVLLESFANDPNQSIDSAPMLTARERHQLLVSWNQTQVDYPQDQGLHHLIEAQVERSPDAIAVVFEQQVLSYRQLNQRANQLAHYLRQLGVGPDRLVGICVERSLDMLIAMLAVLKAGGAYVPIDPAYPSERIQYVLEHAQAEVLLTQTQWLSHLQQIGSKLVVLDRDATHWADQSSANLAHLTAPHHLAYVIYTSGSTGKPKGVQLEHQGVVNFLKAMVQAPGVGPADVVLAVTTLSFDIAVLELFAPLIVGAQVVIASRETAADGYRLLQALQHHAITLLQATPATWRLLLAANWSGTPGLKMLCGGEALPRELAEHLLARGGELWNMYGPTETTVWSAVSRVLTAASDICIGAPIANTEFYVLDAQQQPVPIGVPGELYIGGDGLARGYLHRPDLTAEKFVPHPWSEGARLYRTGDRVRYRSDGRLEFLGRMDYQVKIRGFRIELGEIETTLSQHPQLAQCVVMDRDEPSGDKRLVAYVVPVSGAAPTAAQLRHFLQQTLPDYMLPSAFVELATLPLTPNGKVDRRQLPEPDRSQMALSTTFAAPRNSVEDQMVQIWAQLLQLDRVGIHDNFFELGGHSILAIQTISQIQTALAVQLPLRHLFERPTIAQLAEHCATLQVVQRLQMPRTWSSDEREEVEL